MNTLYYGDCLTIMREKMQPESVDLVYLDPPFNSKRDYNAIYKDRTGRPLPDQVEAFNDTWFLDVDRMRIIRELPKILREHRIDGHNADFLAGFISGLVHVRADMAAYLAYMTERLLWTKYVMKPTASIYLHCDSTASHYLKIVMDVVFGRKNFRREVIWQMKSVSGFKSAIKGWVRDHDVLLYFINGPKFTFNKQKKPYSQEYIKKMFTKIDEQGRRYRQRHKRYYADEGGIPFGSVWDDIYSFQTVANSPEILGYPTQKPLALLDRIIRASSNPGDVVFDPFCGCATTIEAAESLGRRWVGVDITIHAIRRVARRRLQERLHLIEGEDYVIDGVPQSWEGAFELWKQDPYQFQKWCVEQVDGFVNVKKTADDGIDGRIYFDMPDEKVFQSMALEVKGGQHVGIKDVRSLSGVLQFENIQMAGLITLWEPNDRQSKSFKQSMAMAGDVEIEGRLYPRMQLLTVDEIVNGAKFDMPSPAGRTGTGYDRDLWNAPTPQ